MKSGIQSMDGFVARPLHQAQARSQESEPDAGTFPVTDIPDLGALSRQMDIWFGPWVRGVAHEDDAEEARRREFDPLGAQLHRRLGDLRDRMAPLGRAPESGQDDPVSGSEPDRKSLIDELLDRVGDTRKNMLDPIKDASSEYGKFYAELQAILAMLSEAVSGDPDDANFVRFKPEKARKAIEDLIRKFKDKALASFPSEEAAKKFLNRLGIDGLEAVKDKDGKWVVRIKLGPLQNVLDSLPKESELEKDKDGKRLDYVKWNSAKYQGWKSGMESRQDILQNINRVLLDRFSRDYQLYDAALRLLQESIEQLLKAAQQKIDRTPS